MEVIILVIVDGKKLYEHKTRLGHLQVPSKGETITYGKGDNATISRIEWNFDDLRVYVICD